MGSESHKRAPRTLRNTGTEESKIRAIRVHPRRKNSNLVAPNMKLLLVHPHRFPLWNAPTWIADRLRSEFPGLEVVQLFDYDRINEEFADAEIFVGGSLRPKQFQRAQKLRWIHSPSTGVNQFMLPEVIASDVVITNG